MKLPSCWSCGYHFKWRQLVLSITRKKKCPKCHNNQYTTTHSNWKMSLMSIPLIFLVMISNMLGLGWAWSAFVIIIALLIYFVMIPFLLEFTDKDQPLF